MKNHSVENCRAFLLIICLSLGPNVSHANSLGGLLGGDAAKALGGMLGGGKPGGESGKKEGGGLNPLELINSAREAQENSTLGPMGRYYLGRKLSAQVIGLYKPLSTDDPKTQYVKNVVMTVLGASNYAGNYKDPLVIVLDEQKLINAFAAPGNFVFISTGMLNFVESEDELAFVLAHEIAHIELDHGLNAIKSKQGADLFQGAAGNAMPGLDGLFDFIENGFSSDLEGEADQRGAELAAGAGYDPGAGVRVIERLEKLQGRKHGTGYPADRKSAIQKVVRSNSSVSAESIKIRTERFNAIVGK